MNPREYALVREVSKNLQVLGNKGEQDLVTLNEMYLEADRNCSVTKLFEALRLSFRRDLEEEEAEGMIDQEVVSVARGPLDLPRLRTLTNPPSHKKVVA